MSITNTYETFNFINKFPIFKVLILNEMKKATTFIFTAMKISKLTSFVILSKITGSIWGNEFLIYSIISSKLSRFNNSSL